MPEGCTLCLDTQINKHSTLFRCCETGKWRMQFLHIKWLHMNKEVAYKEMLRCTSKALVIDIGRHLDKVKYKCLKRVKFCT